MKVLLVTIFPPEIGGPATQASDLCLSLADNDVDPVVLTFDRERTTSDTYNGVPVYRVHFPPSSERTALGGIAGYIRFARRLNYVLRTERPDVVHCNSMGAYALIVAIQARLRSIPSVVKFASDLVWEIQNRKSLTTQTIEEAHKSGPLARVMVLYEKLVLRLFTLVWATSGYRSNDLVRLLGVSRDRIRVVPNYTRLPEPALNGWAPKTRLALVTGGRFVPHKRFEDLVEALSRVPLEDVDLHFYGGGNRRLEEGLLKQAAELGIAHRVYHHGRVSNEDLSELLQSSDVFVSTSVEEGFAISLVEAMAVGLPVIAVRKGAIPEVVPDGEVGLLYPPGDVDELANAITRLATDSDLRTRLGRSASAHARRYDLKEGVHAFIDLYQDAIKEKAR